MSKFTAVQNDYHNGFSMTFSNGWTISVQFSEFNYCSRKDDTALSAEIAIWDINGDWYDFGHNKVKGYCDANEVAEWIYKVSDWHQEFPIPADVY